MRDPLVAIVIVNYNTWTDTLQCITTLEAMDYPNFRVIVVDNGSRNDSFAKLKEACPKHTVIRTGSNLGFAGGSNVGIRLALESAADLIWLLNNDTLVHPQALSALVELARRNSASDFIGSWITYANDPERVWYGGGEFSRWTGKSAHAHFGKELKECGAPGGQQVTAWITACSLIVRARYVRRYGLMDDSYFLYREDLEWQLRANPLQPTAVISTAPLVKHKVGRTTGTSESYLGTMFMSRNFLKLASNYAGMTLPLWLVQWFVSFVVAPLYRGQFTQLRAALLSPFVYGESGAEILELSGNPSR